MVEIFSQKDIETVSMDILKQSKAIDIFPTPVDRIVHCSDLIFEGKIDLTHVEESFFSKMSSGFREIWGQVRGYLDRSEKTIYIDPSQLPSRQNWVKLHETGHHLLPWQRSIMETIDDDNTLSHLTKIEFEAEANYFSSVTLFQHDRFNTEMEKLGLSLKAAMALSKKFGGSVHASLRRMVEQSRKRCALLVLERLPAATMNKAQCGKRDIFQSVSFTEDFGELDLPEQFGYTWKFAQDYIFRKKFLEDGTISLSTSDGIADFNYHFFDNGYNAFVFLFPSGELQKSRINIIVKA